MVCIFSYKIKKYTDLPLSIVDNKGNEINIFINKNINLFDFICGFSIFIGVSNKKRSEIFSLLSSLKFILNDDILIDNYSLKYNETFSQLNIKKIIMPFKLKLECCICYNELDFLKENKYLDDILNFKCIHYVCYSCSKKITLCPICRSFVKNTN